MVDNKRWSSCHHACQFHVRNIFWLVIPTCPPALCAGDEKLKINELGPYADCMPLGPCSIRDVSLSTTSMKHSLQISMVFGQMSECSWKSWTTPSKFIFKRHILFVVVPCLFKQPTNQHTIACKPSVVNGGG